MWRRIVWKISTDASEECDISLFKSSWRWLQHTTPVHQEPSTRLHIPDAMIFYTHRFDNLRSHTSLKTSHPIFHFTVLKIKVVFNTYEKSKWLLIPLSNLPVQDRKIKFRRPLRFLQRSFVVSLTFQSLNNKQKTNYIRISVHRRAASKYKWIINS
jgi:hypothetical protein